jgi:general stress protein YciG
MSEEEKKDESAAEKTGEALVKNVRKGGEAINNFGKEMKNRMPEDKKKVKDAAQKTGQAVDQGIRKGAEAVNDFGKGIKKELQKKE